MEVTINLTIGDFSVTRKPYEIVLFVTVIAPLLHLCTSFFFILVRYYTFLKLRKD